MRLTGILLAAGASRRFGADKRRVVLSGGDDLLSLSARRLRDVLDDVCVVLRPGEEDLAAAVRAIGCRVAYNPRPDRGLGSSVSEGVRASPDAQGWLIQPADLPLLRTSTIRAVAAALGEASIVVPYCHGRVGHPVAWARNHRKALLGLTGEQGGRLVWASHPQQVLRLHVHDPGICRDLDFDFELAAMRRQLQTLGCSTEH
jgi:molybdenum cofactor cytidylyltransferase